jgi:RTX calcium-binding nonapeptide repeat (4 copies)
MKPTTRLAAALVTLVASLPQDGIAAAPPATETACTLVGTPGDDVIVGTTGDEVICGLDGNDQIDARSGNDVLIGGLGDDRLNGDEGLDVVSFETSTVGVRADLNLGSASGEGTDVLTSVENLTGSTGEDVLFGNAELNTLSGAGGTDLLFGQGGSDSLLGGEGDDYLTGSGGSLLDGGDGTDTCWPASGAVALVSCLSPSPGDDNDTHGFLDVKQVDSYLGSAEPVWRVVTISRWSVFKMWDQGFVVVSLDTFGESVSDYYVVIRSAGDRLRATLYRNGRTLARVPVWRHSRRSVSVRVPFDKLLFGADRRFYRWRVVTLTDRCRRTCFDRIPDEGAMVEPLQIAPG